MSTAATYANAVATCEAMSTASCNATVMQAEYIDSLDTYYTNTNGSSLKNVAGNQILIDATVVDSGYELVYLDLFLLKTESSDI